MTIKLSIPVSKRFFVTALLAGLVFELLLFFTPYLNMPNGPWGYYKVILSIQTIMIASIGLTVGWTLRKTIARSYVVSMSALFYLYAISLLLMFTRITHDALFLFLTSLASLSFFYASDKFINHSSLSKVKKYSIVIVGFFVVSIACVVMGTYFVRIMMPMRIY